MRVTIVDRQAADRLVIGTRPEPAQGPSDAVVRMVTTSLNLGECRRALKVAEDGFLPGWDVAGVVEAAAPDGSGPAKGARVVGFVEGGAWAEKVVLPAWRLAEIPQAVSFEQAATLPVAGLTASYALAQGGLLAGKKVLVDGASGGVGHLACQIAVVSGADVFAVVRREAAAEGLRHIDGIEIVVTERLADAASSGPFDVIVESIGGDALADALGMLAGDGVCVTLGDAGDKPAAFNPRPFFRAGAARLYGLFVYEEVYRHRPAPVLQRMMRLIERGLLVPDITLEAGWAEIGSVARRLVDRKITGKAVIRFDR